MGIICQLSDQITNTFCRCFVTSRFVTFASVLVNEHPARIAIKSLATADKIRPNFDIFATNLHLKLMISSTIRLNRINFPLIVQHFDECFSQELWFGLCDRLGCVPLTLLIYTELMPVGRMVDTLINWHTGVSYC